MKKNGYRLFAAVLACVLAAVPCMSVYATSPAPLPPNLSLVEPQLGVMRSNAYQYALEQKGYEFQGKYTQPSMGYLEVLAAMDAAANLADRKFQGTEEYDATIQFVKDRSGLPDELQGLNMELYFAKITYLDMQLGIYLDELGNQVGNAIVQYTNEIDATLDAWIGTIKDNMLGRVDYSELGIKEEDLAKLGVTYGLSGSYVCTQSKRPGKSEPTVYYHRFTKLPEDSILFTISKSNYGLESRSGPLLLVIAAKEAPEIETFSGTWYIHLNFKEAVLDKVEKKTMSPDMYGAVFTERYGYKLYFLNVGETSNSSRYVTSQYCPYVLLNKSWLDFVSWWSNDFRPGEVPKGGIMLNPNGRTESVAGKAYDYDTVADHCEAVIGTKPVFYPDAEPLPEPLPEGAPLYPPVSGLETIPQPKPSVMPDYEPIPNPNPNPDIPDVPDVPDVPDAVAPITGIKDKFPFCVPYDLIDAFKVMTAEPETPRWEVRFPVPGTNETKLMVIDLEPFNGLAKLTRTLLLLLFIVCLAVGTRNMIAH